MQKINEIKKQIRSLYRQGQIDYFFDFHVEPVASFASEIAKRERANQELSVLSALFHDIARAWGTMDGPQLMNESLEKTEEIMKRFGYSKKEVAMVKHAILSHSCCNRSPSSLEGKILATADALAHLMTDFYQQAPRVFPELFSPKIFRPWARGKIERDFHRKIFFEKDRERARKKYEQLKTSLK